MCFSVMENYTVQNNHCVLLSMIECLQEKSFESHNDSFLHSMTKWELLLITIRVKYCVNSSGSL